MVRLVPLTTCALLVVFWATVQASPKQAQFLRLESLDGLLGQTPVSILKTRSPLECSSRCLSDDGCFSFTFGADSGDCFLHDNHSPLPGASHPGTLTFYKERGRCPEDWTLLNGTVCVKLFAENVNWDNAVQRCHSHGGDLISLQTSVKDTVVRSYVQATSSNHVWIGGHKVSGQWVWEATGEAATVISWGNGQPNGIDENCLSIYTLDFFIHDAPYDLTWHYLCEIVL